MMGAMRTVPYGEHDRHKLDVFLPADVANGRCLFLVHGGGWSGGSRDQWHPVAERFWSVPEELVCESLDRVGYCVKR